MTGSFDRPTRFLFFTGKGGVGKTSLACATAIGLADAGRRVLLVSTDPASNLGEMLGTALSSRPTPIPGVPGLLAQDIDPARAADEYRERVIAPYRGVWDEAKVAELTEELAGACTVEIAAFDAFAALLADAPGPDALDHVVFDTAPTGHTLRLLSLPRAWAGFLGSATQGASCLGPHSGLAMQRDRFAAAHAALADGTRTTLVLVTRPERAALAEAGRTAGELAALGLTNQHLVVNGVFEAAEDADPIARALAERGRRALDGMPAGLIGLPTTRIRLRGFDMVGLPALRALLPGSADPAPRPVPPRGEVPDLPTLASLVDRLEEPGHGLVMVMGKGGVGKTTLACAVAAGLASRGHAVHLSTTDPAAHLASTLDGTVGNLTVSRIDPAAETRAYVAKAMAQRGAGLDEAGRALLAEDLRSPCYEEVAVFAAFARLVASARDGFVVLDTAPTGHTLLLLDATGSYHRQIVGPEGDGAGAAPRLTTPLMRLRDPAYSRILLVTLAEPTPVAEAARLQEDLRRARIEPFAWVVNATLVGSGTTDPCLLARAGAERGRIEEVRARHARRLAVVPWVATEPVGPGPLLALAGGT